MFGVEAVASDVGDSDAEFVIGDDSDEGAFSGIEVDGFTDVPGFAGGILGFETGFLDELHEGSGRAVGDGGFVGVHFDEGVVDAHADESGENVFDGVNAVGADGESGGAFDGFDEVDVGGDERFVGKVDAAEDEAVVDGSGFESEGHFLAGVEGGAFEGGSGSEGVLHVGHG